MTEQSPNDRNIQPGQGLWAQSISIAKQLDRREQPWKTALDVEKAAKAEGTYDDLPDRSEENWEDGSSGDSEAVRMCNQYE